MLDEVEVEVVDLGQRELQHDVLVRCERIRMLEQRGLEEVLGVGVAGLDNRTQLPDVTNNHRWIRHFQISASHWFFHVSLSHRRNV